MYDQPSNYSRAILGAVQAQHVYGGTVSAATKVRRRAANTVARASRRANRR